MTTTEQQTPEQDSPQPMSVEQLRECAAMAFNEHEKFVLIDLEACRFADKQAKCNAREAALRVDLACLNAKMLELAYDRMVAELEYTEKREKWEKDIAEGQKSRAEHAEKNAKK